MSIVYLAADLGPAEVQLEKAAKKLRSQKTYAADQASRLAENAAHQCRMLALQIQSFRVAKAACTGEAT